MRETRPKVFLIAETQVSLESVTGVPDLRSYLEHVGAAQWRSARCQTDAELVIEAAGRLCYKSWAPGLNPNVTRVREGNAEYVGNLLRQRHGSVLEHAQATWIFADVSRVLTHELVRHRAGCSVSQESLRFVRLEDLGFRIPPALEPLRAEVLTLVAAAEEFQRVAAERLGLDAAGVDFAAKKVDTSAMRRLAPIGLSTHIMWTSNLRALRFVIEQRTSPGAEEEVRLVFDRVAEISKQRWPAVFQDFERRGDGSWLAASGKV